MTFANTTNRDLTYLHWNLDGPLADLSRIRESEFRNSFEHDLARCQKHVNSRPDTGFELVRCFHEILQLDARLFAWHSTVTLTRLVRHRWADEAAFHGWLSHQCEQLAMLVENFSAYLRQCVAPLPANIQQWLNSLDPVTDPELKPSYDRIADGWQAAGPGAHSLLSSRSRIDPQRIALRQRLAANRLAEREIALSDSHLEESRCYFDTILDRNGKATATIDKVRDLEASLSAAIQLDIDDAINRLLNSLKGLHPICRQEVEALLSEGRLRLAEPDLCLDTPFGSYVQLAFDGGLESAVRLAHEIGHAIHQKLHRDSSAAHLPLTDVDSETWAMAFENRFMDALESGKPEWSGAVQAFRRHRLIEMNHRHRMLNSFEQALHDPGIQTEADIDRLWLAYNRRFYGDRIQLDSGFESAWSEIHHFFTAPFYLAVYAVAKERADRCDLNTMIHSTIHEKETAHPCFASR